MKLPQLRLIIKYRYNDNGKSITRILVKLKYFVVNVYSLFFICKQQEQIQYYLVLANDI